ncbi:hypothetical protein L798_02301 [Zootermopsis nevadensis]|uniref:Uncharacterized protein n=1 Tax=Zootermopsis nevadensis TaxID=136037 RepID=A0A067QV12_ZOONE|nr:hypothetical protein L798_02301 [Zootermopsis nevadensis]
MHQWHQATCERTSNREYRKTARPKLQYSVSTEDVTVLISPHRHGKTGWVGSPADVPEARNTLVWN